MPWITVSNNTTWLAAGRKKYEQLIYLVGQALRDGNRQRSVLRLSPSAFVKSMRIATAI
jgi:hypothetical protein